ncbi:hypothetical protein HDU93_008058 [Gonapodya sp. JEL0774]|nr:hypothetical protein HDU93_008058 [Gonapodya sp. JEL0774]
MAANTMFTNNSGDSTCRTAESLSRTPSVSVIDKKIRTKSTFLTLWSIAVSLGVLVGTLALVAYSTTASMHSLEVVEGATTPKIPEGGNPGPLPIGGVPSDDPILPPTVPGTPQHPPISDLPIPVPNQPNGEFPPPLGIPRPIPDANNGPVVHIPEIGMPGENGKKPHDAGVHIPEPIGNEPLPISPPEDAIDPGLSVPGPKLPDHGPISILPIPDSKQGNGEPVYSIPPPLNVPPVGKPIHTGQKQGIHLQLQGANKPYNGAGYEILLAPFARRVTENPEKQV